MSAKLEPILAARGIEYRQGGQFEIMLRCPLCGSSDPSQHLAVSTRGRGWRCLRNPLQHRGRSYQRLLALILRIDQGEAASLLGEKVASLPDKDDFAQQWRKQLGVEDDGQKPAVLRFPKEFRRLDPSAKRSDAFWDYLMDPLPSGRQFDWKQAEWVAKTYDLHFAITGRYAYRIIIPITDASGKVVTWTARSINPDADIRYMTLSKEFALAYPGEMLLGMDVLWKAPKAKCLVVGEGPFDAIAVSALGHDVGVWGTCFFGLEASLKQVDLLSQLGERFERTRVIIDPGAWTRLLALRSRLPKRCLPGALPKGYKDPGELTRHGKEFVRSLAA